MDQNILQRDALHMVASSIFGLLDNADFPEAYDDDGERREAFTKALEGIQGRLLVEASAAAGRAALAVPCPHCGATAGLRCGQGVFVLNTPHGQRFEATATQEA